MKKEKKVVKLFGEDIAVKAEILRIDSFSSHADMPHLREWIKKVRPGTRIFINHGEDKVTESFAGLVSVDTGKPATAPYSGEVWDLAADELVHRAEIVPVIRKQSYRSSSDDHRSPYNVSPAYRDLRKSGDELMKLISRSEGHSNKELNKMRREIEAIVSKYGQED